MSDINRLREQALKDYRLHKAKAEAALKQVRLLDQLATLRAQIDGRRKAKRKRRITDELREKMRRAARARWAKRRKG